MIMKFFIQTYGCQMNLSDSERFSAVLHDLGFVETNNIEESDLIIINTCSVKQKAEDRINGFIKVIREKVGDKAIIAITGCIARRIWDESKNVKGTFQKKLEKRENELLKKFPAANIIIETKYFYRINEKLSKILGKDKILIKDQAEDYLTLLPKYKSSFLAYVPISTGCNHFCTFCIVPFSRGKENCRGAEEIINEIFNLLKNGYKEITLLGQTVNRWINPKFTSNFEYNEAQTIIKGLNTKTISKKNLKAWRNFFTEEFSTQKSFLQFSEELYMPRDFLQLLQVIDQIPGEWWLNWVSSHPNYLTDALIKYIGFSIKNNDLNAKVITHQKSYLHFALQSGSDEILKRMNRRHTFSEFYKRIEKIYKECPSISLSTDIITGFVGETDQDFKKTLIAEKKCRFDMIYISEYSPRTGTAAARLKDNVSLELKRKRKEELNDLLRIIALKKNKKLLGKRCRVLITEFDKKRKCLVGKSISHKEVRIYTNPEIQYVGNFVDVKITEVTPWALKGEIVKL